MHREHHAQSVVESQSCTRTDSKCPHPFLKPRLGILRWKGVCPPSNPIRLAPFLALEPLCPLPQVFPVPEPFPLPTRFLSLVAPSLGPMLFSRKGDKEADQGADAAAAALNLRRGAANDFFTGVVAIIAEQRAKASIVAAGSNYWSDPGAAGQATAPQKRSGVQGVYIDVYCVFVY